MPTSLAEFVTKRLAMDSPEPSSNATQRVAGPSSEHKGPPRGLAQRMHSQHDRNTVQLISSCSFGWVHAVIMDYRVHD